MLGNCGKRAIFAPHSFIVLGDLSPKNGLCSYSGELFSFYWGSLLRLVALIHI